MNPSNCECECDKTCDVGVYLNYGNCKCRKKIVDKLVDECTETVEEVKLVKATLAENESENKYSSGTVYIVYIAVLRLFLALSLVITKKQRFGKLTKW